MKKIIISVFALILLTSFVVALELPPEPMAFYGKVAYANGTSIPNGYYITAKIGTAVSGECEIINGEYGKGTNICIVINPSTNTKVEFYLGQYKLKEYTFQSKEIVNLDFITTSLPTNFTPLSNGICEPAKGECSYNILDCDASTTNACAGNGVCDSAIGETCTFTPQDCGVCAFCGDGSCNNGESCSTCAQDCGACPSSGGGGGGGGSSSSSSSSSSSNTVIQTSTGNNNSNGLSNLSIEKLKGNNEESDFGLGITGGVIGFAKSGVGIGTITVVLLLIVLMIVLIALKNKKKS